MTENTRSFNVRVVYCSIFVHNVDRIIPNKPEPNGPAPCKNRRIIKIVTNLHGQLFGERNRAPRFKKVSVVPFDDLINSSAIG